MYEVLEELKAATEKAGVGLAEASMRWVMHHSALGAEDAVILGASRLEQLRSNVADARKGPLPAELLASFEAAWKKVEKAGTERMF